MGTKAQALASAYTDLGDRLDELANALSAAGRGDDAASVKRSENAIESAADDLFGLDAIDTLAHPADIKTLADLTKALEDENAALGRAQNRIAAIVGICTSLVDTAVAFKSGDLAAGISSASTSLDGIKTMTGWHG